MEKKNKPTVLVVDDDKRVLNSFKLWLSKEGYNTLIAYNGNEAVKLVVDNTVDAAIVDFRISKEDGISVAQRLKEVDEDIKIIILTGFPSYETAVQSMKVGVFDYLSKSTASESIIKVLNTAIAERKAERAEKEKNKSDDKRMKMILFCHHSLIKERLENYSKASPDFNLVKTYPGLDALRVKHTGHDIQIALICASCNITKFSDAYTIIPQLYRTYPGVKALIINENFTDQEKVELLRLGIRGFCPDDTGIDTIERAIHYIAKGELWVSRRVTQLSLSEIIHYDSLSPEEKSAASLMDHKLHGQAPNSILSLSPQNNPNSPKEKEAFGLTAKEIEILRKISLGAKNKEIADDLSISESTVKTHINRILKKMGVDNRTKAILSGIERKIF